MLFKTAKIGTQFASLNPELRRILGELEAQNKNWGLPEITMTEAFRTPAEQEEIYWRLLMATTGGKRLTEAEARMRARHKFSWHLCGCAVDLRCGDPLRSMAWLEGFLPRKGHELLVHDVGSGRHLHLAVKDEVARRLYEQAEVA